METHAGTFYFEMFCRNYFSLFTYPQLFYLYYKSLVDPISGGGKCCSTIILVSAIYPHYHHYLPTFNKVSEYRADHVDRRLNCELSHSLRSIRFLLSFIHNIHDDNTEGMMEEQTLLRCQTMSNLRELSGSQC